MYWLPEWREQQIKQPLDQIINGGFHRLTVDSNTVNLLGTDKEREGFLAVLEFCGYCGFWTNDI